MNNVQCCVIRALVNSETVAQLSLFQELPPVQGEAKNNVSDSDLNNAIVRSWVTDLRKSSSYVMLSPDSLQGRLENILGLAARENNVSHRD